MKIRRAFIGDAAAIADIYNQGIEDRIATFETSLRSTNNILDWFDERHILLVAEREGAVVGFAAAHPYSPRECYSGIAELTIYVERAARGGGVGRALLEDITRVASTSGYWKLIGRVFAGNSASRALCRRCGFREVGIHLRHARLDGEWQDIVVVERLLNTAGR